MGGNSSGNPGAKRERTNKPASDGREQPKPAQRRHKLRMFNALLGRAFEVVSL